MATRKRGENYLSKESLIEEILISKKKQKKYTKLTPPECLSPNLVKMLMMLVDRYARKHNFRGYSYIEDMKSEALLNLCQSALKFDPDKSQNPFGYYTMIVHRCFLTFLDKEKQLRKIRDDLIEMSDTDLKPSYARQTEEQDFSSSE